MCKYGEKRITHCIMYIMNGSDLSLNTTHDFMEFLTIDASQIILNEELQLLLLFLIAAGIFIGKILFIILKYLQDMEKQDNSHVCCIFNISQPKSHQMFCFQSCVVNVHISYAYVIFIYFQTMISSDGGDDDACSDHEMEGTVVDEIATFVQTSALTTV